MVAFITDHRAQYGVEPMCAVLPIAPSTYFRHRAAQTDPTRRPRRAQRDAELRDHIQRVWDAHYQVYGPRKVWKQLQREGIPVARCTVRRLMRAMGLRGAVRGRAWVTTTQPAITVERPSDLVERDFTARASQVLDGHLRPVLVCPVSGSPRARQAVGPRDPGPAPGTESRSGRSVNPALRIALTLRLGNPAAKDMWLWCAVHAA